MTSAAEEGAEVLYVKPHGALYNQAQREPDVARAVVTARATSDSRLLGQPGSLIESEARESRARLRRRRFSGPPLPPRRLARTPKRARRRVARPSRYRSSSDSSARTRGKLRRSAFTETSPPRLRVPSSFGRS